MAKPFLSINIFSFISLFLSAISLPAQTDAGEKHILTAIRLIGHELLLNAGDSTSQVLPITTQNDTYTIQFEAEFQFQPEELFVTIDSVMHITQIAIKYIVEVEACASKEIIYSYEVGPTTKAEMIPCAKRIPDKACYNIAITILETADSNQVIKADYVKKNNSVILIFVLLGAAIIITTIWFTRKRTLKKRNNPYFVLIGQYQFDTINSELIILDKRVPFSAKESDLLLLLHRDANTTVEREKILKDIWGDEGDYIGRTLDVFISKLRKKLEANTNLKIVNIRGVGYKLVVEVEV